MNREERGINKESDRWRNVRKTEGCIPEGNKKRREGRGTDYGQKSKIKDG
jgi:hypothetical protein